jgi:hypothetical protein
MITRVHETGQDAGHRRAKQETPKETGQQAPEEVVTIQAT